MGYKLKEVVLQAEVPTIIRLCGWCGAYLGVKPGVSDGPTHGMCPECKAKWDAQIAERKRQKERAK
jgi:hypothetical protein